MTFLDIIKWPFKKIFKKKEPELNFDNNLQEHEPIQDNHLDQNPTPGLEHSREEGQQDFLKDYGQGYSAEPENNYERPQVSSSKEELILSKLDVINTKLDSLNERLRYLERNKGRLW
ncbi:hypothetical protein CL617_00070 [archaeon]|nr:hypothetical protein [archaeon]|tara:strand:+ start:648 stop:998 length:351 start_codon:yes stop_codon:yes gene_type:complete